MKGSVLVIEDDKLMRITLEDSLRTNDYEVLSSERAEEALSLLKEQGFDLIVTDVRLPDKNGIELLREIHSLSDAPVIVMTAFGTIKDAVEAMKLGAFDYITKPFSLEEFVLLVDRAIEFKRLRQENLRLRQDVSRCFGLSSIIGESNAIKALLSMIEKIAPSESTVLITGESGTGKELVATTIHYQSPRRDKPLIKVNCAALPEGLIESELFGHEKGAFTGALKKKQGRFEVASGGTIFLDEVGDLPLSAQAKLLRVLQDKTFERVGGTETIKVDVRIIAATNRDLKEEIKKGRFREDLFYRLNVIPIVIPPLRERKEDIPVLVEYFLKKFNSRSGRNVRFSSDAMKALLEYDYPGNVRELENIVERAAVLSQDGIIKKDDLPFSFSSSESLLLSEVSSRAEKEHILKVLKLTGGNKTRAAELLGISRKTLWEKLNAYGIEI
ncbi:MAG: sigma-54-dependent transcriptional regulator [Thermodesulfovibrionales bacterium]